MSQKDKSGKEPLTRGWIFASPGAGCGKLTLEWLRRKRWNLRVCGFGGNSITAKNIKGISGPAFPMRGNG